MEPLAGGRDDVQHRVESQRLIADIGLVARLGAVSLGISVLSLLVPAGAAVPPEPLRTLVIAFGLVLAACLFVAPWERWSTEGGVIAGLLTVLTAGIVVVGAVIATTGGSTSRFVWIYAVMLLFAGMLLPRGWLLAFTPLVLAGYVLAAYVANEPFRTGGLLFRAGMLVLVAATSRLIAGRLRQATTTALEQAHALSVVAEAARSVHQLEPERVLDDLAGKAQELGYDIVGIYVDTGDGTLRYAATRGIDEEVRGRTFPRSGGVVGQVLASGGTHVETAYGTSTTADAHYQERGVRTAIGTPIHTGGELAGVLVGATYTPRTYAAHDIETFELLAGVAGRALSTANAFAAQDQTLQQMRELDQAKSDFVATVSHELRTPLAVIQGSADTLRHRWEQLTPDLASTLLDRLQANARSLDDVLGSLLDLAQIERGRLATRFERFDLAEVVDRVHGRLAPLTASHVVTVDLGGPLDVHGDGRLIERVVENLISNAARHTPPGTRIEIDAITAPSRATLRVRDHGPGMDPRDVERLGERFFRGGDPLRRPSRGVGLGLALSKEILRLHGSELVVTSQPGDGASFSFALSRVPTPTGIGHQT